MPARCITFARQGYVVFAYDMVGYNDSGIQIAGQAADDLGDGGPVDGAVDPAASEQRGVSGVDDRVDLEPEVAVDLAYKLVRDAYRL